MTEITQFERSVLINKYVKAVGDKKAANTAIKNSVPDLIAALKAQEKQVEKLKAKLLAIFQLSNSNHIESRKHSIDLDPRAVSAHVKNFLLIDKTD